MGPVSPLSLITILLVSTRSPTNSFAMPHITMVIGKLAGFPVMLVRIFRTVDL